MQGCRPLTPEEVDEILISFGGKFAVRDKALFVMGIYTGFRITELLSLRIRDVYQFGKVLQRVAVSKGNMKGQYSSRTVVVHPFAQSMLSDWIAQMPNFFDPVPESYVFRSREGENKPLSRMQAHRILRDAFESCEISGNLGTHSMRKTFARNVHQRLGNDLAKTKQALGHRNISATMHYMSFMDEEIDRAILEQ